jgi:hypothetical protein
MIFIDVRLGRQHDAKRICTPLYLSASNGLRFFAVIKDPGTPFIKWPRNTPEFVTAKSMEFLLIYFSEKEKQANAAAQN